MQKERKGFDFRDIYKRKVQEQQQNHPNDSDDSHSHKNSEESKSSQSENQVNQMKSSRPQNPQSYKSSKNGGTNPSSNHNSNKKTSPDKILPQAMAIEERSKRGVNIFKNKRSKSRGTSNVKDAPNLQAKSMGREDQKSSSKGAKAVLGKQKQQEEAERPQFTLKNMNGKAQRQQSSESSGSRKNDSPRYQKPLEQPKAQPKEDLKRINSPFGEAKKAPQQAQDKQPVNKVNLGDLFCSSSNKQSIPQSQRQKSQSSSRDSEQPRPFDAQEPRPSIHQQLRNNFANKSESSNSISIKSRSISNSSSDSDDHRGIRDQMRISSTIEMRGVFKNTMRTCTQQSMDFKFNTNHNLVNTNQVQTSQSNVQLNEKPKNAEERSSQAKQIPPSYMKILAKDAGFQNLIKDYPKTDNSVLADYYIKNNFDVNQTIKDLYKELRLMPSDINDNKLDVLTSDKKQKDYSIDNHNQHDDQESVSNSSQSDSQSSSQSKSQPSYRQQSKDHEMLANSKLKVIQRHRFDQDDSPSYDDDHDTRIQRDDSKLPTGGNSVLVGSVFDQINNIKQMPLSKIPQEQMSSNNVSPFEDAKLKAGNQSIDSFLHDRSNKHLNDKEQIGFQSADQYVTQRQGSNNDIRTGIDPTQDSQRDNTQRQLQSIKGKGILKNNKNPEEDEDDIDEKPACCSFWSRKRKKSKIEEPKKKYPHERSGVLKKFL